MGAVYGSRFTNSGYSLDITGLPAGYYHLVVYARSTVTGAWNEAHRVIWVAPPPMNLEAPLEGSTVQQPFQVIGWAIDQSASERKDLNADGTINILDFLKLTPPVFNSTCTP